AVPGNGVATENPPAVPAKAEQPKAKTVTPVVEGYGAVVPLPDAAEQPAKGSKVVIDVTGTGKDAAQPLPGLVRAATLLNLAGADEWDELGIRCLSPRGNQQ